MYASIVKDSLFQTINMAEYVFKAVTDLSKTLSTQSYVKTSVREKNKCDFYVYLPRQVQKRKEKKNHLARAKRTVSAPTLGSEEWCGCRR